MYTISLFSLAFATCARSNIIQDRLITIAVLAESMAESESYAVGVRVVGLKLHRGVPYVWHQFRYRFPPNSRHRPCGNKIDAQFVCGKINYKYK